MALMPCRECSQQISSAAKSCPHCGVPNPTKKPKNKTADGFLVGVAVLIGLAIFAGSGNKSSDSSSNSSSSTAVPVQPDPAADARQKAADAADAARKAADCRKDLSCWAEKGTVSASVYCKDNIEKLANYSMKWTDAWYETKFSHYRWSRKFPAEQGVVTYIGDKAQFQNGFGAYQNVVYTCDMIPDDKEHRILDVSVARGRVN